MKTAPADSDQGRGWAGPQGLSLPRQSLAGSGRWPLFLACAFIALLNEVSGGVLTVGLPQVRGELNPSDVGTQLILTSGKLFLGALILVGGALGDVYGRKRVLLIGVLVVAASSLLAAVARSQGILISARALDGIGNAMVAPLALAIAVDGFPEDQRGRAVSLFAGFSALGIALGPLGASILVEKLGWRIAFLMPLLIGAIGGLAILVLGRDTRSNLESRGVDYLGAVLCTVGLLGIVFGCARATEAGWLSREVMLPAGLGALALAAFSLWERRSRSPLIDVRLFENRTILIAIVVVIGVSMSVSGSFLPLFYFLQSGQHHDPVAAVIRLLPVVVTAAVLAPVAGLAAARFGHRRTIQVGLLVVAAGAAVLAIALRPDTPYPVLFGSLVLIGAGNIAVVGPATDLLLASVPPERRGGASALATAAIQVGAALGIPIMVSALLTTARPIFYEEMRQEMGLTDDQIRAAAAFVRSGMRQASSERSFVVPADLQEQIRRAGAAAFALGVNRCFRVASLACVLCAVVMWVGAQRRSKRAAARGPIGMT